MSKLLFCVEISEVVISMSFINFGPDYCVAGLLTVKVIAYKSCVELSLLECAFLDYKPLLNTKHTVGSSNARYY